MKSFRSLHPLLALLLAHKAASQVGSSLLDACDELSIDRNDGILTGKCRGTGDTMLTSVDLDQCLGWGDQPAQLGSRGHTTGLAPVRDGTFTDYCSPCYIVNKDERNQEVAHLLCNCSPDDSDFSTEYLLDLESLVTVTNDGCLECMGVTSGCVRVAPSWTSRDASTESDSGDECKQDHALCCYQTPAKFSRIGTYFEAFSLIEGVNHTWRLHYVIDRENLNITGQLSSVIQFCTPGRKEYCEGEDQPDVVWDLPDDDNGKNWREGQEDKVYDDNDSKLTSPTPGRVPQ